jgi:4-amino-4-deoxy-L-arabinose transferase-like glycosyltransferase
MTKDQARLTIIFSLTYILFCAIVTVFPYEYYDSDSSCYSSISQKLAYRPVLAWCAPQWWGHGGNQGLFHDHPPGILWLPAILVRLGIKGSVAALCANFFYILLSLYFVFKLAKFWGNATFGWGAVFGFVLTPIFLQYLIRANQEHPLNLAIVAGIYGLARSRESLGHKVLFVAALVFAVFIKGMSALILSMLAAIYWLIVLRDRRTFSLIFFAHLIAFGAIFLFELWYKGITHTSFLQAYLAFQGGRSIGAVFHPGRRIYSLLWYSARALWFSSPWVLFLFYGIWRSKKEKPGLFKDPFLCFLLISALGIVLFFSLSDRKADRYIFPAYLLLVLAGIRVLLRMKPKVADFLARQKKHLPVYLSLALVIFAFLRIFFHSRLYRFIRFWPD